MASAPKRVARKPRGAALKEWIQAQRHMKQEEDADVADVLSKPLRSWNLDVGDKVQHGRLRANGAALIGVVQLVGDPDGKSSEVGVEWDASDYLGWQQKPAVFADFQQSHPPWRPCCQSTEPTGYWSMEDGFNLMRECVFSSAMEAKYGDPGDSSICRGGNLHEERRSLSLPCSGISNLAEFDCRTMRHVTDMDLSCNMLTSFNEILHVVKCLPALRSLNISGNRLTMTKQQPQIPAGCAETSSKVETLVMNSIPNLDWKHVILFLQSSGIKPQELAISQNSFSGVDSEVVPFLSELSVLRMDSNAVASWAQLLPLQDLLNLTTLILCGNPLKELWYPSSGAKTDQTGPLAGESSLRGDRSSLRAGGSAVAFAQLQSISLSRTALCDWAHLDALAAFPSLRQVRLQHLPLLQGLDAPTQRMLLISHLPNVCAGGRVRLPLQEALAVSQAADRWRCWQGRQTVGSETCGLVNGGMVTAAERRDAHRFFLQHYQRVDPAARPARYKALLEEQPHLALLVEEEGREPLGEALAGGESAECDASVLHDGVHAASFDARGLGRCI